jgi:linoleate 10R-lipoxygenase
MRRLDHEFSPQGEGNVVSIEFNLLYRWHATLSQQDTQWTEGLFTKVFPGKDFSKVRFLAFYFRSIYVAEIDYR